jgi:hypothetical protein
MTRRTGFAYAALALLGAPAVGAQDSRWRLLETQDELSGARDRRLILRAENWSAGGATLIIACGDHIPGAEGRTLLLNGGMPLHPFGGVAAAYAEISFDAGRTSERHYWRLMDDGGARVAFIGDSRSPFFSDSLFTRLIAAAAVEVRYRALGGDQAVRFDLRGLREELRKLPACRWPGL